MVFQVSWYINSPRTTYSILDRIIETAEPCDIGHTLTITDTGKMDPIFQLTQKNGFDIQVIRLLLRLLLKSDET